MQFYLEDREEKEKDADKNICPKFKEVNSESTPTPTPSTAKEDEGTAGFEWHTFVSPTLETFGELVLPQPREYNFLHRLLQLTRSEDKKFLRDYICFGGSSVTERLLHTSILAGVDTIFFTTALQSFNVNGTVIQLAAMRSNLTPPLYLELANELALTTNVSGDVNDSPSLFVLVVNAIDRHIGGVLPLNTLATRSWNAPILAWGFAGPFGLTSPHHPPRFGNPMCLTSWLDTFPVEWGLVDYHTTADLRHEVVIQGTPVVRGWYASGGSPDYRDVMLSTSPYSLKSYGALAMNIIAQALTNFLPPGQPAFSYQTFAWDRTGLTPAVIVPANPNPPI
ncbi:unnamed protein product [Bemisia tabaci]|uniref:Uncharacterized protein n=1 Tax=Bemisia tabaci TaxID=7038 RepID=A0A9N9ZZA5_BEMTA|nr:unnamed protein product [Bemisia tabaci]